MILDPNLKWAHVWVGLQKQLDTLLNLYLPLKLKVVAFYTFSGMFFLSSELVIPESKFVINLEYNFT